MTKEQLAELTGADILRRVVNNMGNVPEYVLDDFTTFELVNIGIALLLCEFDIYPDEWTHAQLKAAAKYQEPPRFERETLKPLPPLKRRGGKVVAADAAVHAKEGRMR